MKISPLNTNLPLVVYGPQNQLPTDGSVSRESLVSEVSQRPARQKGTYYVERVLTSETYDTNRRLTDPDVGTGLMIDTYA